MAAMTEEDRFDRRRRYSYSSEDDDYRYSRRNRRSRSPSCEDDLRHRLSGRHRDRPYGDRRIDPLQSDHIVEWRIYAQYLRDCNEIGERPATKEEGDKQYTEITERYQKYKEEWKKLQIRKFFDTHCTEEWVMEKYHPQNCGNFKERVNNLKKKKFIDFVREMNEKKQQTFDENEHRKNMSQRTVLLAGVPRSMPRLEIEQVLNTCPGFEYLTLSEPRVISPIRGSYSSSRRTLGHRVGWAVFQEPEYAIQAQKIISENELSRRLSVSITETELITRPAHGVFGNVERMKQDLETVLMIAKLLDDQVELDGASLIQNELAVDQSMDSTISDSEQQLLDSLLEYLRKVHFYCYYSGGVSAESYESLVWKCGDKIVRKEIQTDSDFLSKFDAKIRQTLEPPPSTDHQIEACGGIPPNKASEDYLSQFAVQEDTACFRCDVPKCSKKFRDSVFVVKHIRNKHPDVVSDSNLVALKTECLNMYLSDPHALNPATDDYHFDRPRRTQERRLSNSFDSRPRTYVDLDAPAQTEVTLEYD